MKILRYVLAGLAVEAGGVFAFVRLANAFQGTTPKYIAIGFSFFAFVFIIYNTSLHLSRMRIAVAFLAFSIVAVLVMQLIGIFFYPGIIKDVELFSFDHFRTIVFLIGSVFLFQVVIYVCIFTLHKILWCRWARS